MKSPQKPLSLAAIRSQNTKIRLPCSLYVYLTKRPPDRRVVFEALFDETIQVSALQEALKERGWTGNVQILNRHRRHGCVTCHQRLGFKNGQGQPKK